MVDLHFHTTLSDGKNTSKELAQEIIRRQVSLFACTDHDIVNREVLAIIREYNRENSRSLKKIPYIDAVEWVEVSIGHKDGDYEKSLHITMYARHFSEEIDAILAGIRQGKMDKIQVQCDHLGKIGLMIRTPFRNIPFSFFWVQSRFPGTRADGLNNSHLIALVEELPENIAILHRLTDGGITEDNIYQEGFKREGKYTKIVSLPEELPPYEPTLASVTRELDMENAVVSVAHPDKTFESIEEFRARIGGLIEQWVNAVEINSDASEDWVRAIAMVRKEYDLIFTFGSDVHNLRWVGENKKVLGNMNPFVTRWAAEYWKQEFLLRTYGHNYRMMKSGEYS